MPENIELKTFPAYLSESIALLYVQNQNLSGKSPVEIYRMYQKAQEEVLAEQTKDFKAKCHHL